MRGQGKSERTGAKGQLGATHDRQPISRAPDGVEERFGDSADLFSYQPALGQYSFCLDIIWHITRGLVQRERRSVQWVILLSFG